MFELKITEDLCVMTPKGDAIFKEKFIGGFKNDIRNLINFHASCCKSENLLFGELVLSKAYKVLDEKVQKSTCVMILKGYPKKSLFLRNMHFCDRLEALSGR